MRIRDEEGQAVVMVALAMGIFLVGAVGLGFDGSILYSQRQMAQSAADSAAQAAMMSVFTGTNTTGGAAFSTTGSFTCDPGDGRTPCVFAAMNYGFGSDPNDVVQVSFPTSVNGVALATGYPAELVQVDVSRSVATTLMRMLGPTATTVHATATAAIVSVASPVPILVTHPTLTQSLSLQGTPSIAICGGPNRSIEVNSSDPNALQMGGSASIDLSKAGPPDPGNCTTGSGADLGVWGGPATVPGGIGFGTKPGRYIPGASWMQDPLANVPPPPVPTNTGAMGTHTALASGVSGCPASPTKPCQLYNPGLWTGIDGNNSTPVFKPGIYYIQGGGMTCAANCNMYMAAGFTDSGAGTTGTGWTNGMLVYNTGTVANPSVAGAFSLGANGSIYLTGSPPSSSYHGILFFQDRSSAANSHSLGGGGDLQLQGTIYLTNTRATMFTTPSQFQSLTLSGHGGSNTLIQGEIIVGSLTLGGSGGITMELSSTPAYAVSEVALVQ